MIQSQRRIKLIKPRLQVRLTLTFVGLGALALVLQFLLLLARLSEFAVYSPEDGNVFFDRLDTMLLGVLATSALLVVPLIFAVGILTTFRIAGPVYRFEKHLRALARGERPGACRLRKGDELQEMCELLNRAVEALESQRATLPAEVEAPSEATPAAGSGRSPARVVA